MSEEDKPEVEKSDIIEPAEMPDEEGTKDTGDPTVDHSEETDGEKKQRNQRQKQRPRPPLLRPKLVPKQRVKPRPKQKQRVR